MEQKTLIVFEYIRGGKTFITPNELIAALRSDNGIFTQIEYKP